MKSQSGTSQKSAKRTAKAFLEVVPSLSHVVGRVIKATTNQELTVSQYRILTNIHRGLRYVGELSERQAVSEATMSRMVDGLVNRDLVRRVRSVEDRRHVILSLTAQGFSLFEATKTAAAFRLEMELETRGEVEHLRILEALDTLRLFFLGPS